MEGEQSNESNIKRNKPRTGQRKTSMIPGNQILVFPLCINEEIIHALPPSPLRRAVSIFLGGIYKGGGAASCNVFPLLGTVLRVLAVLPLS